MSFGKVELFEYRCDTPGCDQKFQYEVFVGPGRLSNLGSAPLPRGWRQVRPFKNEVVSGHTAYYCPTCCIRGIAPTESTPEHLRAK